MKNHQQHSQSYPSFNHSSKSTSQSSLYYSDNEFSISSSSQHGSPMGSPIASPMGSPSSYKTRKEMGFMSYPEFSLADLANPAKYDALCKAKQIVDNHNAENAERLKMGDGEELSQTFSPLGSRLGNTYEQPKPSPSPKINPTISNGLQLLNIERTRSI